MAARPPATGTLEIAMWEARGSCTRRRVQKVAGLASLHRCSAWSTATAGFEWIHLDATYHNHWQPLCLGCNNSMSKDNRREEMYDPTPLHVLMLMICTP